MCWPASGLCFGGEREEERKAAISVSTYPDEFERRPAAPEFCDVMEHLGSHYVQTPEGADADQPQWKDTEPGETN
jgi:hypothetical protein